MLSFLPHPQKPKAVANARIQRSLHLSGNPQTALSGCARWNMPFSGLGLIFGSKGQLAPRPRRPGTPAPATIADYQLLQTFLLRSTKEAILTSWGLGKFKETTLLKKKDEEVWCLVPFSVEDVAGSTDISLMWLGALTSHSSLSFFFKHQRLRTSFSVEKTCLHSVLPRPDLACINPEA